MVAQPLHHDVVVIIGAPGSGKTYITEALALSNPNHIVIHTDDYIVFWYEQSLYKLLEDLQSEKFKGKKLIIEWVWAYRLLRKWVETDSFYPDAVIEVTASTSQLDGVYESRGKNPATVHSMQKGNETVLAKYKALENKHPPQWLYYDNNI